MAGLNETNKWETEIYRIEENDPVHGGEDGITNKPLKQLANRTKYLKAEVEKRYIAQDASTEQKGLVQLDSSTDSDAEDKAATPKAVNVVKALVIAVRNALNNYIPNSKKSNADNSSSSDTIATSYALKKVRDIATTRATDAVAGQTVLSHKINGTDKTKAATEFALGELNKELAGKGVPIGAVVAFPKGMNPSGYLRAIGGTFNRVTYPDLYVANGNSDILPNLHRSDVGMTVYFPFDDIPEGWIAFDSIRTEVTQQNYPELYQYLVEKYGAISNVPLAEDRFIRNTGNGLNVGQTQGDAIRNITGEIDLSSLGSGNQFLEFESSRNNEVFKGAILPHQSKWTKWTADQDGGAEVSRGFKFDASTVVPTADENRPKSIVLKLCIKAKNTFDDVQFWIKAFGVVENAGALDAGTLAQNLQQADVKIQQLENSSKQNQQNIQQIGQQVSQLQSKLQSNAKTRKIWQGNATAGNSLLTLSESIINKNLVFYLQPSVNSTLNNNDVATLSCYVDSKLSEVQQKRFLYAGYFEGGWRNLKIEVVNETQIKIIDTSGFYLKAITASN
ncbi:TPA: tail fiber protein [Pasteurella multocida]|uniref:tail fiber protein n=1 Tax=Pasteurella multocida TaxID=747 RepID=UPI00292E7D64|nr:tail fiber protein [Pasteurella multocida]WNY74384.1 tail fiber protein [Pasteurella multocida]HDR1500323.1 tail fiber protein [Pasteurella multocida]HDR1507938.1 tail fiber protein [Pasteurella multocida]